MKMNPKNNNNRLVGYFWNSFVKDAKSKYPPLGKYAYNIQSKGLIGTPWASSSNPTKGNNNPQTANSLFPFKILKN